MDTNQHESKAPMAEAGRCNCWEEKNEGLAKMGFKISGACQMYQVDREELRLCRRFGLPLERTDGNKLERLDPRMISISHCPFCGAEVGE